MKKLFKITMMLIVCGGIMAFTSFNKVGIQKVSSLTPASIYIIDETELTTIDFTDLWLNSRKTHSKFLDAIGEKESTNDYTVTNKFGYLGKYQFHIKTLKSIGIKTTKSEFLSNPDLQEEAMDRLLKANLKTLQDYIEEYDGTVLHGVLITESGVLAAAHLAGAGNVRKFFKTGKNFKDGFGTSMTDYMKKFSGYQLDLN